METVPISTLTLRARSGDREAQHSIVEQYDVHVRRQIQLIMGKWQEHIQRGRDVDDLAQDVWLEFFRTIDRQESFANHTALAECLHRIARHKTINALRHVIAQKRDVRRTSSYHANEREGRSYTTLVAPPPAPAIWEYISDNLPERDREIIERVLKGDTYTEICATLGCSEKTIQRVFGHWSEKFREEAA